MVLAFGASPEGYNSWWLPLRMGSEWLVDKEGKESYLSPNSPLFLWDFLSHDCIAYSRI